MTSTLIIETELLSRILVFYLTLMQLITGENFIAVIVHVKTVNIFLLKKNISNSIC